MGQQTVETRTAPEELRHFIRSLLNDITALEKMIDEGMLESGVRRIGAEQELVLVNQALRPAPVAEDVLRRLRDQHFTHEIGLFNLEINLDPLIFRGGCLSKMESHINELVERARNAARACDAQVALTGVLPTLRKSDLGLENMTPRPRYLAMNDALKRQRGWAYEFRVRGADELIVRHDTWMLEACCTSFQVHFQCGPEEFANLYNAAQLVTAPVLAAAANSPLLFGRRLWEETRIPLFEQSVDTRNASYHLRERSPRVSFGNQWLRESALELFREDIARFHVLVTAGCPEDPFEMLRQGHAPALDALRLYNGTVWRWNRACYGVTDGRPHLRIEARALPAGPTVADEVANAAFFFGLMSSIPHDYQDIAGAMDFDDAKANFLRAAQLGLDAQFTWVGGEVAPARELICSRLIPAARTGLRLSGILESDIDRYLGIIEERVASGRTGARWMLDSLAGLNKAGTRDEALSSITAATVRNQQGGRPVHEWPLARATEAVMSRQSYLRVEEFMTTDLFTVYEDEPLDLVASLMAWKRVRHVPVEDAQGKMVGLISSIEVLKEMVRSIAERMTEPVPVSRIMAKDVVTVGPETPTLNAISLMRQKNVDCLPVVREDRLVGIVTERDFINVAARLLEQNQTDSPGHQNVEL